MVYNEPGPWICRSMRGQDRADAIEPLLVYVKYTYHVKIHLGCLLG